LADIDEASFEIIENYITDFKAGSSSLQELFSNVKTELERTAQTDQASGLYALL